jgi:hypothetical protein
MQIEAVRVLHQRSDSRQSYAASIVKLYQDFDEDNEPSRALQCPRREYHGGDPVRSS